MLDYTLGKGQYENWVVSEIAFSPDALAKCESIMYLGNGYMGLRSALEEPYLKETRNLFINGTFNRFADSEVTELPNVADVTRIDLKVDGQRFSLEFGDTKNYLRQLNLKTAELVRTFDWISPLGKEFRFKFRRFVSLDNLHLIGMKMEIESISHDADISFETGINAQMTNSGTQHFHEGEKRIFDRKHLQLLQKTTESDIDIVITTTHRVTVDEEEFSEPRMDIRRRKVSLLYHCPVKKGSKLVLEKLTAIYTSRDKEFDTPNYTLDNLRTASLNSVKEAAEQGYEALLENHVKAWENKVWSKYNLNIVTKQGYDQLALRFALYHLTVMAPAHDERMGIAAKGLSGEGYKGHSFWDTEIFILPFFTYSNPDVARSLLTYRYHGLAGARRKAMENGYKGAMYPWEAAWPTDGEVTPVWGAVDIVTGKQTKIWSGFIEQHITADIAYAVHQYYTITGDSDFMEQYGYEMIFDTAKFWASRLEWNDEKQEYHINDVIGPDEYKEHVNNNAFTNYMAHFNIRLAIQYYQKLLQENSPIIQKLENNLGLKEAYQEWLDKIDKIYLPSPRPEDSVIPQDDTYLSLPVIDLRKYKESKKVGTLFYDYNLEQVNRLQVTKQADVLILIYLLEQVDQRFTKELKEANFNYYEPKTLHDSSLSLSTHAIMANDLGYDDLAYNLFRRAAEIDLGPFMHSSDEGIHAASIGGIWQAAIFGFAGIRIKGDTLSINPRIPKHWEEMDFTLYWKKQAIRFQISQSKLTVIPEEGKTINFESFGRKYETCDPIEISIDHKS